MTKACPIPTPIEREYGAILGRVENELMRKVGVALAEATEQARSEMERATPDMPPPSSGYFASIVHQQMYCTMCGADPKTFEGGRADAAIAIIRNSQNIAKHYWGAKIEPLPQSSESSTAI